MSGLSAGRLTRRRSNLAAMAGVAKAKGGGVQMGVDAAGARGAGVFPHCPTSSRIRNVPHILKDSSGGTPVIHAEVEWPAVAVSQMVT